MAEMTAQERRVATPFFEAAPHNDLEAMRISEDLLQRTGEALMTGDFAKFAACFALPHVIETFEGSQNLETQDDLLNVFRSARRQIVRSGANALERQCLDAKFVAEDRLETRHNSRMMNGPTLVRASYPVFSVVIRLNGQWLIKSGIYAVEKSALWTEERPG